MDAFNYNFFNNIDGAKLLTELFEDAEDLYFFAKDLNFKFILCNRALLQRLGIKDESDIRGRDDYYYFDPLVADHYRREDQEIFDRAEPIKNRIWIVPNASGVMHWYISSKFPLFDNDGKLVGLAGLMRDCPKSNDFHGPYQNLAKAINYIHQNFTRTLSIVELADICQLSVSQLERSFRKYFKISPMKYINRVRVDAAARLLIEGTEAISMIAQDTGFYDHSHFTKQFKAYKGMSPSVYRNCKGKRAEY